MTETEDIEEELEEELEESPEEEKAEEKPKKKPQKMGSFKIKKENSRIIKNCIETLAAIVNECYIVVKPKEFSVTAMDDSRICLFKLVIKKDDFDEFQCSKESNVGLNLEDFDKILKRSSKKDSITLEYQEKEQKIKIKMQEVGASRVRTFSLSLIEVDYEKIPMDSLLEIDYESTWDIETDLFSEALKDAEIYSEIFNIEAKEEGLIFSSSGTIGEMAYNLPEEDLIEATLKGMEKGSYSVKFLKAFMKIAPITEQLRMSLKTDHPLRMIFSILEGGELNTFTAPRVEEIDDNDMDSF